MASRDADLRLSFTIDQARAKAATKSVSGLDKTVKDLDSSLKTLAKTAGTTGAAVGNGLKRFSAEQVSVRNELLKGTQALKEQVTVLDLYKQKLAATQQGSGGGGGGLLGKLGSTGSAVGAVLSGAGAGQLGQIASIGGQLGSAINQIQQVSSVIQGVGASSASAVPGVAGASASLGTLALAAPLVIIALVALSEAIKKVTNDIEQGKRNVQGAIASQKTYYELLQTGTTESIKAQLAELKVKQAVAAQIRSDIQAQIESQKQQFGILGGLVADFTGLSDELKKADEETQDLSFQIDAYTRALNSNQVAQNDAKAAAEEYGQTLKQQADDQQAAAQRVAQEEIQIRDRAAQEEAQILQRASDQRIALARRTAQMEQDALAKVQADLNEGRIRLDEQQADTRLEFHRQEARSARDHLRNLIKIRKDAEASEFELILNRDFAGLARQRRETDARLQEEQERYAEERQQRLVDLKNKLQDNQRSFQREREQRVRQYQQQLADIRRQQINELQANSEAATLDLQRLRDRLQAELAMKQSAYTRALELEAQYLAIRERLLSGAISAAQAQQQSSGSSSGGTGGGSLHLAGGGPISAGQTALVNEGFAGQRESFRSGGQSVMLPGGMGLFKPLRSGRVDSGGGGISISMPISVSGSTWAEIRRKVHADVDIKLSRAFEELAG